MACVVIDGAVDVEGVRLGLAVGGRGYAQDRPGGKARLKAGNNDMVNGHVMGPKAGMGAWIRTPLIATSGKTPLTVVLAAFAIIFWSPFLSLFRAHTSTVARGGRGPLTPADIMTTL